MNKQAVNCENKYLGTRWIDDDFGFLELKDVDEGTAHDKPMTIIHDVLIADELAWHTWSENNEPKQQARCVVEVVTGDIVVARYDYGIWVVVGGVTYPAKYSRYRAFTILDNPDGKEEPEPTPEDDE